MRDISFDFSCALLSLMISSSSLLISSSSSSASCFFSLVLISFSFFDSFFFLWLRFFFFCSSFFFLLFFEDDLIVSDRDETSITDDPRVLVVSESFRDHHISSSPNDNESERSSVVSDISISVIEDVGDVLDDELREHDVIDALRRRRVTGITLVRKNLDKLLSLSIMEANRALSSSSSVPLSPSSTPSLSSLSSFDAVTSSKRASSSSSSLSSNACLCSFSRRRR
mmetsp:Transcript_52619/g.59784  ORF Transcript_52619/g.59784 Transcript_52619/m.59784 type:complete len:226 (+) Transcript_52619:262-939(+)